MPPARLEPAISAIEGPQTYVLDRTVTGIGINIYNSVFVNMQNTFFSTSSFSLPILFHIILLA